MNVKQEFAINFSPKEHHSKRLITKTKFLTIILSFSIIAKQKLDQKKRHRHLPSFKAYINPF